MDSNVAEVTDIRSNPQDQIAHAVRVINKSKASRAVFEVIYRGKKKVKTLNEIRKATKMKEIRILQETKKLYANKLIGKIKIGGRAAYTKDLYYAQHKDKILRLLSKKDPLKNFATKTNPIIKHAAIKVVFPKNAVDIKLLTIDDIDSFSKVKKIKLAGSVIKPIAEQKFKLGIQKVISESGIFKDWGGEKNDLFTTRLLLNGKRTPAAFAFKGKGTVGALKPGKMGKNGDQIQRLFDTTAEIFLVQYWGQIDQSVLQQMQISAIAKSYIVSKTIFYCIIDGQDTHRLILAYPEQFK